MTFSLQFRGCFPFYLNIYCDVSQYMLTDHVAELTVFWYCGNTLSHMISYTMKTTLYSQYKHTTVAGHEVILPVSPADIHLHFYCIYRLALFLVYILIPTQKCHHYIDKTYSICTEWWLFFPLHPPFTNLFVCFWKGVMKLCHHLMLSCHHQRWVCGSNMPWSVFPGAPANQMHSMHPRCEVGPP